MSLFDIDKGSLDRGDPQPNHSDQLIPGSVKAHGTLSANYTTDATSDPAGGTNTGTPGGGPTVQGGYKRLVLTVPVTVVNDGSTLTTASLAHGLTYVPIVEGYMDNASATIAGGTATGASIPLPTYIAASISGGNVNFNSYVFVFANATNIYINLLNGTGSPVTVTVTVLLYQRITG